MTKLCKCGCGRTPAIATKTFRERGWVAGEPRDYVMGHQNRGKSGASNGHWKGGARVMTDGYVGIRMPEHPRANKTGYVREHLLVAERALGRTVPPKHPVHHVDEVRSNNAHGNLVLCEDTAYHRLLHKRQRALDACGDPNAEPCRVCGGYDRQGEMRRQGRWVVHPACQREQCNRNYRRRCENRGAASTRV